MASGGLEALDALERWFGFVPDFHDAEVVGLDLRREPAPSRLLAGGVSAPEPTARTQPISPKEIPVKETGQPAPASRLPPSACDLRALHKEGRKRSSDLST